MSHVTTSRTIVVFLITIYLSLSCGMPPTKSDTTTTVVKSDNAEKDDLVQREESCKAILYKQKIAVEGCTTVTINNHFCRGQCISGYLPDSGQRYRCSSCQPSKTVKKQVLLECENGVKRIVDVELFMGCSCMQSKCHKSDYNSENFGPKTLGAKAIKKEKPCRDICRKCRKAKRDYETLQKKKEQMEYLKKTCVREDCKKRISEDVFGRARMQRKIKKAACKDCKICKKRKREKSNA